MKFLAFCVLAIVAAAEARSTGLSVAGANTAISENPWLVHLRVALLDGAGRLGTCGGSLLNGRWVLTAVRCVERARFMWIRYGASNVINPELVTETSTFFQQFDLGLVSILRDVEFTPTISPIKFITGEHTLPETGKFCAYGEMDENIPGEELSCSEWTLEAIDDGSFEGSNSEVKATQFDLGTPLVSNGVQYGVLVALPRPGVGAVFVNPARYESWINDRIKN
ncbi:mast cell protease 1-like [Battus philenor]|uniref:mast cell protease 1-like n=1 Tax=Battus philenor TaxID=42288 RepID=UPI0035D0404F